MVAEVWNERQKKYNLNTWKSVTLAKLFGGQNKCPSRLLPAEIDAESELMQALAEIDEDECPNDGEVEILSEDEYVE